MFYNTMSESKKYQSIKLVVSLNKILSGNPGRYTFTNKKSYDSCLEICTS